MPFCSIRCSTTPGSSWPGRVPIGRPSSAVKPMVVSMLRPPRSRAHRGAAAEVGDDDPAFGDLGATSGRRLGDVLVAEAVEAVAADALVVEGARQRVAVGVGRVAAVEGGVEAGDLRHLRGRSPARGGSARGCSAGAAAPAARVAVEPAEDGLVDRTGRSKSGPPCTTRWPMARSSKPLEAREPARVAAMAAGRSGTSAGELPVDELAPSGPAGLEPRTDADAVDLPLDPPLQRPPSMAKIWNLRLDEPALRTRIACIRPPDRGLRRRALA